MRHRHLIAIIAIIATLPLTPSAMAQPHSSVSDAASLDAAFDKDFAIGAYFSNWHGDYTSTGVGLRLRWEPLDELGFEVYTELLDVDVPHASRMDIPAGFNVYIPIQLFSESFRIRPLVGLCTMLSFVSDDTIAHASSDDVLFGVHAGLGAEFAVSRAWSVFLDATYQGYFGHERDTDAWTASISRDLESFDHFQVGAGLQFHL